MNKTRNQSNSRPQNGQIMRNEVVQPGTGCTYLNDDKTDSRQLNRDHSLMLKEGQTTCARANTRGDLLREYVHAHAVVPLSVCHCVCAFALDLIFFVLLPE